VHLAVAESLSAGGHAQRDVVDLVALRLQRPADDRQAQPGREIGKAIRGDGAGAPRDGQRLVERGEGVAGDRCLGQHRQGGARARGIGQQALDMLEVAVHLADARVELAGRHANRAHRSILMLAVVMVLGLQGSAGIVAWASAIMRR